MRFKEIREDITTLASRTIRNYARELGPDSMDYGMFMKSAELLDKGMLKSLAQLIDKSDTAPREYVMKKIADHDPETFKKMYGDQEGYLSVMKPGQDLKDSETVDEGADFLGYFKKDEKTWSFPDGMETKTPHRSNHAARTILQALGLPMDFEHEGPIPLDQFIKATRNYMEKNDDQKDTDMYQNVYMYDQEALRMKANHKEITHVAFA